MSENDRYKIISTRDEECPRFLSKINEAMMDGWEPCGCPWENRHGFTHQAMIRPELKHRQDEHRYFRVVDGYMVPLDIPDNQQVPHKDDDRFIKTSRNGSGTAWTLAKWFGLKTDATYTVEGFLIELMHNTHEARQALSDIGYYKAAEVRLKKKLEWERAKASKYRRIYKRYKSRHNNLWLMFSMYTGGTPLYSKAVEQIQSWIKRKKKLPQGQAHAE